MQATADLCKTERPYVRTYTLILLRKCVVQPPTVGRSKLAVFGYVSAPSLPSRNAGSRIIPVSVLLIRLAQAQSPFAVWSRTRTYVPPREQSAATYVCWQSRVRYRSALSCFDTRAMPACGLQPRRGGYCLAFFFRIGTARNRELNEAPCQPWGCLVGPTSLGTYVRRPGERPYGHLYLPLPSHQKGRSHGRRQTKNSGAFPPGCQMPPT